MAYRFNMDLQELRRLMGWIEWRCDVLKDHPQLPLMVQVVRAHLEDYHDLFDANPFQHSMLQDAKAFGHRMLKGVGDSICSNPNNVFVAENADKVPQTNRTYNGKHVWNSTHRVENSSFCTSKMSNDKNLGWLVEYISCRNPWDWYIFSYVLP